MSELLDKQVNVQKEILKKTSGVHASSRKPTKKVCDENETKQKNDSCVKNFVVKERTFIIRPYQENGCTDFDELRIIDSSNNEGTNSLLNGRIGRGKNGSSAIKLAMAGT